MNSIANKNMPELNKDIYLRIFVSMDDVLDINNIRLCNKSFKKIVDDWHLVPVIIANQIKYQYDYPNIRDCKYTRQYFYDNYKLYKIMEPLMSNYNVIKHPNKAKYKIYYGFDCVLKINLIGNGKMPSDRVGISGKGITYGVGRNKDKYSEPKRIAFKMDNIHKEIIDQSRGQIMIHTICSGCRKLECCRYRPTIGYDIICMDCCESVRQKKGINPMGFGKYKKLPYKRVLEQDLIYCLSYLNKDYNKLPPIKKRFVDWLKQSEKSLNVYHFNNNIKKSINPILNVCG
jgi:hypothetical protein